MEPAASDVSARPLTPLALEVSAREMVSAREPAAEAVTPRSAEPPATMFAVASARVRFPLVLVATKSRLSW